ncbi:hypothetical protein C8A01DRAFT_16985 [Parachaetomium inaequale]|uniref:Invertebrate defensins family profile domain-containing protein n=1 Tax=Parachaetomium inaequale TaxID=2588326 RepID=A0AAN6PDL6_9PEZI|nr:hypothetical protein C8A01DRAFT_16985 [Parachaetomium inaequale]
MRLHPILLLTLTTAAAAIPATEDNKPNTDVLQPRGNVHVTSFSFDADPASSEVDGDDDDSSDGNTLTSRASTKQWNAKGGCKRDWGGRCLNTCKSEARKKGYNCDRVKDQIWKEDCWLGWCVCACYCFR